MPFADAFGKISIPIAIGAKLLSASRKLSGRRIMRSPRPGGAKFKNFPYHMDDPVEIKKIQSSKSKVQNKFCHGHLPQA
jgi:hypothetical protein